MGEVVSLSPLKGQLSLEAKDSLLPYLATLLSIARVGGRFTSD